MKYLHIKLIKSLIGRQPVHVACARGLGLRRIGQQRKVMDTLENRGMISKIRYLLEEKKCD